MTKIVSQQLSLRQSIPTISGCLEYTEFCDLLERIDGTIQVADLDTPFISGYLERCAEEARACPEKGGALFKGFTYQEKIKLQEQALVAFRTCIARALTGESFRDFHIRLADSAVLQWFCRIDLVSHVRVPSKSSLERFEKYFSKECMDEANARLLLSTTGKAHALKLELESPLSLDDLFFDSTCVKTNIHYPVDWTLLRDAIRTLMKATGLIRKEGLKHRMEDPIIFIRSINKLSIQMSGARRKNNAKRERKRVLRLMKKLLNRVEGHAQRHRDLLEKHREKVSLSPGEVNQILFRIDGVMMEIPKILFQAHERIIGERQVANEKKLLSLYEKETRVIVRGKLGAEVEYGNTLLLVEQVDGLIVDWDFFKNGAPGDSKLFIPSLKRIKKKFKGQKINSATTDRGFWSPENANYLREEKIANHLCPRSVPELKKKLEDPEFCVHQNRRSQTEGRVGIFKNNFLGRPLRSKGFEHRELKVGICVLSHNLWVLGRIINEQIKQKEKAA